ncbi:MAG TPA: hypothetical protein PLA43_18560 [Bryobacteraceae bacterium]|nr:hypothetical protein [Bryobacteraceae bacterium]HOL70410.1 hypothetical protein [Bryobacteraceae bacterium]HOQ46606.1 hypothetical protein [Bryobacteraceae bacterium]HPQ14260.1 hypothetical protein [Bryobacteraceae bacterium]HPU73961.1 hypothetical protein [Bryobacteraceae bacterium]
MGLVIALFVRLVVPLSILRWPLGGLLASMAADGLDVVFVHGVGGAPWPRTEEVFANNYALIDKSLDTYYLTLAFLMSRRWPEAIARRAAAVLYFWRVAGLAMIVFGGPNWWLLIFANFFENFYLVYAIAQRFWPGWRVKTARRLAVVLVLIGIPKLVQEYYFHVLDITPWPWFQRTFLS